MAAVITALAILAGCAPSVHSGLRWDGTGAVYAWEWDDADDWTTDGRCTWSMEISTDVTMCLQYEQVHHHDPEHFYLDVWDDFSGSHRIEVTAAEYYRCAKVDHPITRARCPG